jgi:hypothetical protein
VRKTYTGSCHCGAVRFEVDIDFSAGTMKCNCSICTKNRNWNAIIMPDAFRLLTEEDAMSDYQFGKRSVHHLFCRQCGVHAFERGYAKKIGGDFIVVLVASLDNVDLEELIAAPIRYADGRNNNYGAVPAEIRHL